MLFQSLQGHSYPTEYLDDISRSFATNFETRFFPGSQVKELGNQGAMLVTSQQKDVFPFHLLLCCSSGREDQAFVGKASGQAASMGGKARAKPQAEFRAVTGK